MLVWCLRGSSTKTSMDAPKGCHKIRGSRMIGSETIWEHALRDFSSAQFCGAR